MSDRELRALGIKIPPRSQKKSRDHTSITTRHESYNDGLAFVYIKLELIDEGKEWLREHGFITMFELGIGKIGVAASPSDLTQLMTEKPAWLDRIIPNAPTFSLIN